MYSVNTRINVSGISPWEKLVNEASSIIIKTTPEAPIRALGKKKTLRMPVTKAVMAIITSRASEP
jgi:hypothetical protein